MYINFSDSKLREILDIMFGGLIPFSDKYIEDLRNDIESDLTNLRNLELLKTQRNRVDKDTYDNKEKEIYKRLKRREDYIDLLDYGSDILNINIQIETDTVLNKVINSKKEDMDKLYTKLTRYIKPSEFDVEYYVLINIIKSLSDVNKINRLSGIGSRVGINKNSFIDTLEVTIPKLVESRRRELNIEHYMKKDGMDTNFNIESTIDEACTYLYTRCVEMYERLDKMNISMSQALDSEIKLKSVLESNLVASTIEAQTLINGDKLFVNNKYYSGAEDCIKYAKLAYADIDNRLRNSNNNEFVTMKDLSLFEERREKERPKKLANFGIEVIDESLPIMTRKLYTITAMEGTGKTMTACHIASKLIEEGRKVLFISTETSEFVIIDMILSSIIKHKYNVEIPYDKIANRSSLTEDLQKLLRMVELELGIKDLLMVRRKTSYEEFKTLVESMIVDYGIEAVIVDHSALLAREDRRRDIRDCISQLGEDCIDIQENYPVAMIVTSHPSTDAKADLRKFGKIQKETSVTRDSSDLSRAADLNLFLSSNQDLDDRGLISVQIVKLRGVKPREEIIFLRKKFSVASVEYHAEDQALETSSGDINDVLNLIDSNIDAM